MATKKSKKPTKQLRRKPPTSNKNTIDKQKAYIDNGNKLIKSFLRGKEDFSRSHKSSSQLATIASKLINKINSSNVSVLSHLSYKIDTLAKLNHAIVQSFLQQNPFILWSSIVSIIKEQKNK